MMMHLKSSKKTVWVVDDADLSNAASNAYGVYSACFLYLRRIFKIFIAIIMFSISLSIVAETSHQSLLPEHTFSPDKRVVCNAERAVCFDRMGPSIGLTRIYLGDEAAQRVTIMMREQLMLSGSGKVFFPTQDSVCIGESGPCIINGDVDEALNGVLFGPWQEDELNTSKLRLYDVEWQWVGSRYNDDTSIKPPEPSHYTLNLLPDGSVHARADCNRAGGRYSIEAHQLRIDINRSTRAACAPDSLEAHFLKDIARTGAFFLKNGQLYIDLNYHSGTMQFSQ
jgi:heat shock protein HslJ